LCLVDAALIVELDRPAKRGQWLDVPFAVERREHVRVVVDRGDGRSNAAAERFAIRTRTKGPVAAVPLAGVPLQLDERLFP
jgi:hypothetical protein